MTLVAPESEFLRQGDICSIIAFPSWRLDKAMTVTSPNGDVALQLPLLDRLFAIDGTYLVAVCSQCCDLRRPKKRTGILIAPLRRPPVSSTDTEKLQELRASARPDGNQWKHVGLFPLELSDGETMVDVVVDFSQMISLSPPEQAVSRLLQDRRFAFSDDERDLFRTKLAASVGRPPSDDEN